MTTTPGGRSPDSSWVRLLKSSRRRSTGRGPNRRRSTSRCHSLAARSRSSTTPRMCRNPISCGVPSIRSCGRRKARLRAGGADRRQHHGQLAGAHVHAAYAGQFDAFLPGLAALHLPFPLGGSSNHFRTAVLRQSAAGTPITSPKTPIWAFGSIASAIARRPCRRRPMRRRRRGSGRRQRTRWYKGWMQTWLVHMRRPARLVRELNPAGAIAFQLFLACNVLAALIHPVFMAGLCWSLFAASPLQLVGAMHAAPVFVATFLRLCLDDRAGYGRAAAAPAAGARLGAVADAALLVPALGRRVAWPVPAPSRSAGLGEDRARAGKDLALGENRSVIERFSEITA